MAVDLEGRLINPDSTKFGAMLSQLQGNILKGHGRDHTAHLFLEFKGDVGTVRQGLSAFAEHVVTSALRQHHETQQFKKFHILGSLFGSIVLSAQGYRALGFSEAQIKNGFPEEKGDFGVESNFREGMRAHRAELNDPIVDDWEKPYGHARLDAMVLLADDDEGYLLRQVRALLPEIEAFATVVTVEIGKALRTEQGEGIEHFGYVDGRSQPIYFKSDLKGEGTTKTWKPDEPLKRVLVADTMLDQVGDAVEDAFGSYFVFRKLEQDVRGFKMQEQKLADALGLTGSARELAGAMVVGRFEDGTPVTLQGTDGRVPAKDNDFDYKKDEDGIKCPFQAHIRKTNPRGDIPRQITHGGAEDEENLERRRRITRRGITYGKRNLHPQESQRLEDLPSKDVGLLFMCFQSSIANQFAFMQVQWANSADFVTPTTGIDPVVGQLAPGESPIPQKWSSTWGQAPDTDFAFAKFVHMKGGEFFFAPSLPFFRALVNAPGSSSAA